MSWWMWALVAWVAISVPAAVLVARAIRVGQSGDVRRERREACDRPRHGLPTPREGGEEMSA